VKRVRLSNIHHVADKRQEGYAQAAIQAGTVDGEFLLLTDEAYQRISEDYTLAQGPGTELTKIIAWMGLTPAPGCACKKRARYMDKMGCDWCEQNVGQIVGWLQEEHARTKSLLPFVSFAAEKLVRLAIRRARKGNSQ
jgi:hypothetical protein